MLCQLIPGIRRREARRCESCQPCWPSPAALESSDTGTSGWQVLSRVSGVVTSDALRQWRFFSGLDDGDLQALADIAYESTFEDGDTIFQEGSPATTMYLLRQGWVDINVRSGGQGEQSELVTMVTRGDVFGWSALVEPHVYTASAGCATPVSVLAFPADKVLALIRNDAGLCYAIMNRICQVLASRLRATRQQLVSLYVVH